MVSTNPFEQVCASQIGFHFPKGRGEIPNISELPPPSYYIFVLSTSVYVWLHGNSTISILVVFHLGNCHHHIRLALAFLRVRRARLKFPLPRSKTRFHQWFNNHFQLCVHCIIANLVCNDYTSTMTLKWLPIIIWYFRLNLFFSLVYTVHLNIFKTYTICNSKYVNSW